MRKTGASITIALAGVLLLIPRVSGASLHAQVEMSPPERDEANFYFDAIAFADAQTGGSRIDIFSQVGYSALAFVKRGDRYDASYELTISIHDSAKTLVSEKTWNEEVNGVKFEESTTPSAYSLTRRVFPVSPGRYTITVAMRDNESKAVRRLTRDLPVSDFSTPSFSLSDIMLISRVTVENGRRTVLPNISGNVGDLPEFFYLYFEVYNRAELDSVRFIVDVLGEKERKMIQFDTVGALHPGRNEEILQLRHGNLPLGDYRVFLRAYPTDSSASALTGYLGTTNRALVVRWTGFPKSVKDIDIAIEQIRYIAEDADFKELKAAKTVEEKQAALMAFWKKRDPNPNTPRNERMEEYYRRADYANKHFAHYIPGWKTDMGMVYMMFGPPNDVQRYPFEMGTKPYEIWRYYEINYDIIFTDETGFGDYRLLYPIWEAWQRYRNRL